MKTFYFSLLVSVLFFVGCVHKNSAVEIKETVREPASAVNGPPLRFEQCTIPSRLYLENKIASMPREYYQSHEQEWSLSIPMRCMQIAQRNFSGHFAKCGSLSARPTTNAMKPCMTEKYTTLTYNAYHDVMDCFNLNPKDFFLQIMIESGFHVNAINKTGFDSGITQFTGNGIKRITTNNLVERTRSILLQSSRGSCQRISSIIGEFNMDSFSVKNRCSVIALPENPYRAMFFNYLHTMLDQIAIDEIVDNRPDLKAIVTDKIKRHLIFVAYNRGTTGLRKLLDGYLESRKNVDHVVTEEDFELNVNLTNVKRILRLNPEKRKKILAAKKIKNLSFAEYAVVNGTTYLSDMSDANEYAQKLLGDECGGL